MKLLRSELIRGLHEELFDISIENISSDDVGFKSNQIPCEISSFKVPTGFKVVGTLDIVFQFKCDRCLSGFELPVKSQFEIWLTPDQNVAEEGSLDMIWFPDSMDEVDLDPTIIELILLEVPYKNICTESCKGLCHQCGTDLNKGNCSCEISTGDPRWDVLKKISKN